MFAGDVSPASTPLWYFLSHSTGFCLIIIIIIVIIIIIIIIIFNINEAGRIEYFPIVFAQLFIILAGCPAQLTLIFMVSYLTNTLKNAAGKSQLDKI